MFNIIIADIITAVIIIVWLIAACVTDVKKREVADWLSFSLLGIVLAISALKSILTLNSSYILYSLLGGAIFFGVALLFYHLQIFGGGDAKLLIALGAAFANKPIFTNIFTNSSISAFYHEPFLLTFIINLLFVGAVYGLIWSIILVIKKKNIPKRIEKKEINYKIFYFVLAAIILILAIILRFYNLIFIAILLVVLPYLFKLVKTAENSLTKRKSWKELAEGDWLMENVRIGKKTIKPSVDGLSKNDIILIKKANKKVLIKDGIPFVPAILIAILISLFVGNLLLLLIA